MSTSTMTVNYVAAFDEAIAAAMREDPDIFLMGTLLPARFATEFGEARARQAPISEPAMTGMAIGAAAAGKRPVVFWRNITFAFNSFDQVMNEAAKIHYMFGGQRPVPVVFRAVCGGGQSMAAQHSQSPYSIYAHIAGLKVIVPSSPGDAMGLMRAAIAENNPVVCFEPARLATVEGPIEDVPIPLGVAEVKREGSDVTVVAIGYMVGLALEAAETLSAEGISVEVVDPRTISPLDVDTIRDSVRRTGRLVVADEAPPMCSMAAEITAAVAEDPETFALLVRAPIRVCAAPVPVPFSPPLEQRVLPDIAHVVAGIRASVEDAR